MTAARHAATRSLRADQAEVTNMTRCSGPSAMAGACRGGAAVTSGAAGSGPATR
ncbi:hypothetical protein ACOZ38_19335 [Sphaerisporangium viridialbum]|uniref:hypothetical protein n=1 Tax=Sphaerisporangium viridialbum TaxID=46189 RepID=UPI003C777F3C